MQQLKSIFSQRDMAEEYGDRGELYFSHLLDIWDIRYQPKPYKTSKWDFKIMDIYIDVKTLINNYRPNPNYYVNIAALQLTANIDIYAFVFFNQTNSRIELVGAATPYTIQEKGALKRKGDAEKEKFKYLCDTYVVQLADLDQFVTVLDRCLCSKYKGDL